MRKREKQMLLKTQFNTSMFHHNPKNISSHTAVPVVV